MYASVPEKKPRTASKSGTSRKPAGEQVKRASASRPAPQRTARDQQKRGKTQGRDERQYTKQRTTDARKSRAAEDAPRAAVYTSEKNASQRKSARMQRASEAEPWTAKINPAGWLSRVNFSSRKARFITIGVCALFVCVFLYTPTQQYYQAMRENARLEVEYAAVAERNAALDAHNEALASDAGMEDAVRQKYGYVIAGEQTATVTGLSDEVDATKRADAEVEANILASSIKAPEEWYTPILDTIFGVE